MNRKSRILIPIACLAFIFAACTKEDSAKWNGQDDASVIRIGGVDVDGNDVVSASLNTTRGTTTDAADVCESWLKEPLFQGWDVVYWLKKNDYETTHRIAKVTLQEDDTETDHIKRDDKGFPDYTFKYRTTSPENEWPDALWHGDGVHIFRGEYAPADLLTGAANLPTDITTNQYKTANYDLLSHYLSMGPNCEIVASVARTNLPYRHRLSRLIIYVLIDPNLKNADGTTRATIKGYQLVDSNGDPDPSGKDDPATSSIDFSKIEVLNSVTKTDNVEITGHSTYTPQWGKEEGRIIPHSLGEFGSIDGKGDPITGLEDNCVVYYDDYRESYIVPSSKRWKYYRDDEASRVTANDTISKIEYGLVPCYDLIVRPTYTKKELVMYDEDFTIAPLTTPEAYLSHKNSFDVKIILSNGLTHTSHVEFNLDANFQLAGYLFVNKEEVDYEESDAVLWNEKVHQDGWYGPDNALGHTLSKAGSSWQRAYRIGSASGLDGCGADEVTDGNFYDKSGAGDADGAGQYLTEAEWKAYFQDAVEGGAHHGDYFILDKDYITLAGGITFTGHLDAQGNTIFFSAPLTGLNGNYSVIQETDPTQTWQANVHQENGVWVPWKTTNFGYRAEILNAVIDGSNFVPMTVGQYDPTVTGYIYNCRQNTDPAIWYPDNMKAIPQY